MDDIEGDVILTARVTAMFSCWALVGSDIKGTRDAYARNNREGGPRQDLAFIPV